MGKDANHANPSLSLHLEVDNQRIVIMDVELEVAPIGVRTPYEDVVGSTVDVNIALLSQLFYAFLYGQDNRHHLVVAI